MQNLEVMGTGVPNLDAVLGGGVPLYSLNVVAGRPGTGKTVLVQQMVFSRIREDGESRALYITTLSEPTVKVVRYMQRFAFFDPDVFGERVIYQDVGRFVQEHTLLEVADRIVGLVEEHGPEVVVIDSFKAVSDLAGDPAEFRLFVHGLSVRLAAARCTTFLVGEYDRPDIPAGVEFAVADGILYLDVADQEGERRRVLQVLKMRGRATEMAPFPFVLDADGIRVLSPALVLSRPEGILAVDEERLPTGIPGLDVLLHGGIGAARSVILSGVSGTGKTTLSLQFLVRGAERGERGLLFSFEQSPDRLRVMAEGFGWDLRSLEEKGLLRMVFVPQAEIRVEEHLEMAIREVEDFRPRRLVVDSFSILLHRVTDPAVQRDKIFQLATLVRRAGAVGLLISDIPAEDTRRLSRFGVEETVADGTIVLSTEMKGLKRKRYVEVYKMAGAEHVAGRQRMEITGRGVEVLYATRPGPSQAGIPPPLAFGPLQAVIGGDVGYDSAWLVRGDAGVGKSTLAYQFGIDGLRRKEAVLYISADAPATLVRRTLESFGFLPDPYLESGQLSVVDAYAEAQLDPADPEAFLFAVAQRVEEMPKPLRAIIDSLTPVAVGYAPGEFVDLVHRKNRMLRRPDVAVFDTLLKETLAESDRYSLINAFDVVIDMYTPDWGEMKRSGGGGYHALHVRKARGAVADTRPYPYTIVPTEGVVVQKDFYRLQTGTET